MKSYNKISIRLILASVAAVAALIAVCPARADLGDTYAQTIHSFGQPAGTTGNVIWWRPVAENKAWIGEVFHANQCVMVLYTPMPGQHIVESEIWRMFAANSRPGAIWQEYNRGSDGIYYVNQDASLYGLLSSRDGTLRICYASYLRRHGLFTAPNGGDVRPPVEDGSGSNDENERPPVQEGV